jgi:hypothetical protein
MAKPVPVAMLRVETVHKIMIINRLNAELLNAITTGLRSNFFQNGKGVFKMESRDWDGLQ